MRTRRGGAFARVPRAEAVFRRRFAAVAIVPSLLHRKSRVMVRSGRAAAKFGRFWPSAGRSATPVEIQRPFN
jgi:hypothetical protein